ncbi:MAG: tetratricopeptide repeat protein [Thermomicrobiales bacterium]
MTTSHEPAATEALRAFGQLLRRLRHAADLTQEQLAERALVSPRSISELERGSTHWPRIDTINLLADGLELAGAERAAFVGLARGRYAPDAAAVPESPAVRLRAPAPPTPIIGREAERAAALAALRDPQVRLLTLVGPGGVGKTRLALELAQHAAPAFPDGVQFVDLAPLRDPAFLYDAIAQALELPLDPAIPLQRALAQTLQERAMLLILDNFEQIAPAAPAVAYLLSGCPRLRLLVTSRLPLRVRAEHVFPVEPLALPDPGADPSLADLADVPAVALFVNRAAAASPGFALTAQNARAVAHITQRLDGLPLAIELAANRIKVLSPTDLLERLGARLPLLTRGAHDLPERQQALRSTLAWSYDLLDDDARRVFRFLSVFAGGCTLEAAEWICQALVSDEDRAALPATHALDLLTDLVEKSLLFTRPDLGDAVRFSMLETIREYGGERLLEAGETERARRDHLAWCLHLAETADPLLLGTEQEYWNNRLSIEHDNLRAALSDALAQSDPEPALRLCASLYRFWANHGRYEEGLRWLEQATARASQAATAPRGHALVGLGVMLFFQGAYERAASVWNQALALFLELGDVRGQAYAHGNLGLVADAAGDYPRALAEYEAARELFRELDDRTYMSYMTHNSGLIAYFQGNYALARQLFTESLGMVADENSRSLTLGNLSLVALAEGRLDQALALQQDAFAHWRRVTNLPWLPRGLEHFALIAIASGDAAHGVRLLGAAAAERARIGGSQPDNDRAINERYIAEAQAALGAAAYAACWAEGEALALPEAIALALR